MTKRKNTKRALITSALALIVSISMLAGSTYAWFTDSVTSAGNIIKSGTLDVDLVDEAGKSLEGEQLTFKTADGRSNDEILWEPGCTYEVGPVYVQNNGNLALKYNIVVNGIDGDAKLLEAIDWTINIGADKGVDLSTFEGHLDTNGAKSEAIVLSGHMREEAGNEYQNLTADGIGITVVATQYTYEKDSFDNQYDKDATYPTVVNTAADLASALAAGGNVTLGSDINGGSVATLVNIPAGIETTLDLNGHDISATLDNATGWSQMFHVSKGATLTVKGEGNVHAAAYKTLTYGSVIFNNDAGNLIINGGTYTMEYGSYDEGYLLPSIVDTNSNVGKATTIINGGTFYHTRNMFRNFAQPQRGDNNATLIINGGTFNGEANDYASIWNQNTTPSKGVVGDGVVELNGGTFNYIQIDNEFADNSCIKIDSSITNVKIV